MAFTEVAITAEKIVEAEKAVETEKTVEYGITGKGEAKIALDEKIRNLPSNVGEFGIKKINEYEKVDIEDQKEIRNWLKEESVPGGNSIGDVFEDDFEQPKESENGLNENDENQEKTEEGSDSNEENQDENVNEELTEKNDTDEPENKEEDGEQKELTEEEINELQKKAIQEAFERIARGEQLTDAEKGNLGEMLMDQYYIEQGYKPIHSPRVTDLQHKSGQGIDGVYEKVNPDGSKSYIIADAKVNHSQLNKGLADGTDQMSDAWVEKRLDDAVGKEKADEIRDTYEDDPESVNKEVYHFSYYENGENTGVSDVSSVDRDGNREGSRVLVQTFDAEGNATYENNTSEDSHER